jgi:prevent-host-death family protein
MAVISATEAKNRFGELLEMARKEPVEVQKNGRTVGAMISAEDYARFREMTSAPKVRPAVDALLTRSIERRKALYEALAR